MASREIEEIGRAHAEYRGDDRRDIGFLALPTLRERLGQRVGEIRRHPRGELRPLGFLGRDVDIAEVEARRDRLPISPTAISTFGSSESLFLA